jgi:predicted enzyme related to lactoylglutathione lyase
MAEVQKHAPGNFCWIENGTTDRSKATAFYSKLFGWDAQDVPAGDMTYTLLSKNGKQVGGMYELTPDMRAQGVPSNWLSYVCVDSADEAVKNAAKLGGNVVMDAMDVMDIGRMAVFQDPTGAHVAVWQPKNHKGAQIVNEPGAVCWTELATRDKRAAASFYRGMFDWDGQEQTGLGPLPYTMWMKDGAPAAGMFELPAEMAGVPPHWMPYFQVEDTDATVEEAKKLGGNVLMPPTDIPTIGRFATLTDPTGAAFSVIKMANA